LRSTISHLAEDPEVDWTDLALSHGYYDQPHLIHEFQDLVGYSPSAFTQHRNAFSPLGAPAFGRSALPKREQLLYRSLGLVSRWVPASKGRNRASYRPEAG
jgi:AraC-like DNA-binding protein